MLIMIKNFIIILLLINILWINGLCEEVTKVIDLNVDNYQEEVLKSKIPVVVYFWAIWCKPCKRMSPIIERLAIFYDKKIKFLKVDADGSRKLLDKFRPLRGLPLFIFFKNGKENSRILGQTTFTAISSKIIFLLKEEKVGKKAKKDCSGGVCLPPPDY